MKKQYLADLALVAVTLAWGLSFILTKNSLAVLSSFNFLALRFWVAGIPCIFIFYKRLLKLDKSTVKYGWIIGGIMFSGYALNTIGLNYTTASKSAFITGLAVILVPVFSAWLFKQSPKPSVVLGVICASIGLALLTLDGNVRLNIGDFYTFLSAILFAFQVLAIAKYAVLVDPINLAILQICIVGLLSTIASFLLETPTLPTTTTAWIDMLFLSLLCTSGAFIVQNAVQKHTTATHTALIFTGEPVFATMFAYLLGGELLSTRGIVGGILIISAMIFAELDLKLPFFKPKAQPTKM
ncbi:DMT family transporter [Clostridiaceae bacterium 35-E11]